MIKTLFSFFNADGLLKDSSVLLIGMICVQFFNVFFQMVMGRCLHPEEYAMLISLLGVLNILSIPLGVVSSSINRYSSLLIQQGRVGDVRRLVLRWAIRLLVVGVFISLGCYFFSHTLATFFHLDRTAPILIFGFIVVGLFCRPVFDGALMGIQCFGGYSVSSALGSGIRLMSGGLLVVCVSAYSGWGLLGHGLGFYVALGVGMIFVFRRLRHYESTTEPLPKMHAYMLGSFFVLLGYSILMTGDVVLVKHLFPDDAPSFSYAATLGRLVIFIPQAFISAMFPKVVSDNGASDVQRKVFTRTLFATLLLTVCASVLFIPLTRLGLLILYGIKDPSSELVLWSRLLAVTMIPVALLNVATRFALAQHRLYIAIVVPLAALCYLLFVYLFPTRITMVLYTLGSVSWIGLIILSGWLIFGSSYKARGNKFSNVEMR